MQEGCRRCERSEATQPGVVAPDCFVSLAMTSRRAFCRRLALAQEAVEQAAFALARNEIDIADEFCAALAPLQHDLAAMKGFQLGAMRDADDGGPGQRSGQKLHH